MARRPPNFRVIASAAKQSRPEGLSPRDRRGALRRLAMTGFTPRGSAKPVEDKKRNNAVATATDMHASPAEARVHLPGARAAAIGVGPGERRDSGSFTVSALRVDNACGELTAKEPASGWCC
jgi:hypothetical protein